ncbi:MAG: ATP-binding cassette domain-containing protein [Chloroflexota bacterium]|nr:ATP-binding cassette domain-containing protein [Chloroflexota bacterium]
MPATDTALSMSKIVVHRSGQRVLSFESFNLARGESLAIIGANGSGKSSFLLAASLLIPSTEGEIFYFGTKISRANRRDFRRLSSISFQDPVLLDRTVVDNLKIAMDLRGFKKTQIRTLAYSWLERLGVEHLATKKPHELSGGERQRVSLARAFALQPAILMLDEPFTAIDPVDKRSISRDLHDLINESELSSIVVTHDISEAVVLASKVVVLIDGFIHQAGAMKDVLNHPKSADVANLIGHTVLRNNEARESLRIPNSNSLDELISFPLSAISLRANPKGRGQITRYESAVGGIVAIVRLAGVEIPSGISAHQAMSLDFSVGQYVDVIFDQSKLVYLSN